MSLSRAFKTDPQKEVNGIAVQMPPNDDGTVPTFIIARSGQSNARYRSAITRIMAPVQAQIRTKSLKDAQADALLIQAFVEGCLLSWQAVLKSDVTGIESDEGFADFNVSNAVALFTRLPELYAELQTQSSDVAMFRSTDIEENAKN